MMYYIRSASYDATLNLALEQYVFDRLDRRNSYMMLWRNANAIIIGKHQNTVAEINASYVQEHAIQVVRRLSGGGAVYHDMGNINFTFITDTAGERFDFAHFCYPVVQILQSLGVKAELKGRNDMTINGMKFSGNSQYIKQGRIMHHGTIMFDSNLDMLAKALTVSQDKIESKGIKSTYSRVTNVRPHIASDCSTEQFMDILESRLITQFDAQIIAPAAINMDEVYQLQRETYSKWEWNYGSSPAYNIIKKRRFEGVGEIELRMEIADGYIQKLAFFGDFFAIQDIRNLVDALIGVQLNESSLGETLSRISVDDYFRNLKHKDLMDLFL